jgi:RimJ/RimL family protein N-acetyltransferase
MVRQKRGSSFGIQGERIYLREVSTSDIDKGYHRWMNDPEVIRYTESRFSSYTRQDLEEYIVKMQNDDSSLFLAIVLNEIHRHIGNIKLGPINTYHRLASVGILIGEKECWGKGYATEAIRLLANYAFEHLNLHKLTAGCIDANKGGMKAFQKAGFSIEGIQREHNHWNGAYHDVILFGLINERQE